MSIGNVVLLNAVTAALLALGAATATLWVRRPAVAHLLWVAVLVELIAPPVIGVGVIPRPTDIVSATVNSSAGSIGGVAESMSTPAPSVQAGTMGYVSKLGFVWLVGSLAVAALALARSIRFRRLVRSARPCARELQLRLDRLGRRLGLVRPTRMRVIEARVSPLVWQFGGAVELIFPAALLARLSPSQLDAILAHELAHVRRRDHWVRWLELAAFAVYWWHPVSWWARARLRRFEERSCDELVLQAFPRLAQDYARGLLVTLEYLVPRSRPVPALACGIGRGSDMKERLIMILKPSSARPLGRISRLALGLLVAAAALVFPTWAERAATGEAVAPREYTQEESMTEARRAELFELEREARELEQALHAVRARQEELKLGGMRKDASAAEEAFHAEELARAIAERQARTGEAVEGEIQKVFERDLERELAEVEGLDATVRVELVRAHRERAAALERALEESHVSKLALERDLLRARLEAMRTEGASTELSPLEAARLVIELREHKLAELDAQAEHLRDQGLADAADELDEQARELERAAEELERRLDREVSPVY